MNNIDYLSNKLLLVTTNNILFTPVKNYSMLNNKNDENLSDKEVVTKKTRNKKYLKWRGGLNQLNELQP